MQIILMFQPDDRQIRLLPHDSRSVGLRCPLAERFMTGRCIEVNHTASNNLLQINPQRLPGQCLWARIAESWCSLDA